VLVPEWLSGMTRNHVGSARAGSNPAEHASLILRYYSFLLNEGDIL
jgi:hypothetical protein